MKQEVVHGNACLGGETTDLTAFVHDQVGFRGESTIIPPEDKFLWRKIMFMRQLKDLFLSGFGVEAESVCPLSDSGSNRRYYRMKAGDLSCIGVIGTDPDENKAFVVEARHFVDAGLPVPEVIAVSDDWKCYLQSDLGDVLLYDMIVRERKEGDLSENMKGLLCRTVALLAKFQFEGGRGLDFNVCYPEPEFSRRMVMFDLNYFKYCFLKPSGLEFNEVRLQDDFEKLADRLLDASSFRLSDGTLYDGGTFMLRDFQSRNVMVHDGEPYFIDFQGGRRGPLHYDVASFIWHARSGYSSEVRDMLTDAYMDALTEHVDVDRADFVRTLRVFVLFRTLQVLGAYGFRGWMENKAKFVTSIPSAIESLKEQLCEESLKESYPYLHEVLSGLAALPRFEDNASGHDGLTVTVYSFSFHKGVPHDPSGNGGGYVFDCRSIHNPGRYEPYKKLTGRDREVIDFLENDGEVFGFLEHVYGVVDPHVETFSGRGFRNLMVSFGCTGGQHRSVYCAEHLARHLTEKYPSVRVRLIHREQRISAVYAAGVLQVMEG